MKTEVQIRLEAIEMAVARIRVMGGYYGLDEKQTDDLAAEISKLT